VPANSSGRGGDGPFPRPATVDNRESDDEHRVGCDLIIVVESRIRKGTTSEQQTVKGNVRNENVDVLSEGDVRIRGEVEETQR